MDADPLAAPNCSKDLTPMLLDGTDDPRRRHSGLGYLSPTEFETQHTAAATAA